VIDNVLGLLGIVVFIVCVIALAAAVTWLVVRVSPKPGNKQKKRDEAAAKAEATASEI
jgi:hypothetical protein